MRRLRKLGKKRLKKWRESNLNSLYKELNDINIELLKLRSIIKSGGAPENPAKIRYLRRQKARILTIIRERKGVEKVEKSS